ncbi:hypothetical protein [Caulobacter sp. NIBR1757]|uniref:hypothetical protein n=1 Tax=Caulobacter sp. NIBR1757 TaxID=3016000 RepID=UPI0022F0C11D|nr:hypothetical protein [Caulobacter sp. NIBR1757]
MSDERSDYKEPPDPGGLVPPGWFLSEHTLLPDPTLKGYLDRGQSVFGQCVGKDCQRKASMDLRELLRITGPSLHIKKIADYMRCSRLEGCRFRFTRLEPRCDVPLDRFARLPNVRLRVRCNHCFCFTHRKVDAVIAWLTTTGQGSPRSWISDVERLLTARCGCGGSDWKIEVIIFDTANPRWRQQGDKVFEDRPFRAKGKAGQGDWTAAGVG